MTEIQDGSLIKRMGNLLVSEIDGELVMLSVERGNYYGLSAVGKRIWELLDQPRDVGTLCILLQQEFEETSDICKQEVLQFIGQLLDEKMVEVLR